MRISWLYFANLSVRETEPVLICPQFVATAKSAIIGSSVSPERCETTARYPALCVISIASKVSLSVPIWFNLIRTALAMPATGWRASAVLVIVAISLLIPWNVVGTIWQIYGRADIGLMGATLSRLGIDYNYTGSARDAWITVLVMDIWHWTPLVALLAYAGLRAIPDAYYQAARIDGASKFAVFRYIQLPKMRGVLMIAVLLRFMDSFMIYTEPFVLTGGGPGNSTTFLSQYLTQKAVGQFDLGPAAAFSLIYFLIILLFCFVLYNWMQRVGTDQAGDPAAGVQP